MNAGVVVYGQIENMCKESPSNGTACRQILYLRVMKKVIRIPVGSVRSLISLRVLASPNRKFGGWSPTTPRRNAGGWPKETPTSTTYTHAAQSFHCKSIAQFCLLYRTGFSQSQWWAGPTDTPIFHPDTCQNASHLAALPHSVRSTNRPAGDTLNLLIRRCYEEFRLQTSMTRHCTTALLWDDNLPQRHRVNLRLQQRCETKPFQRCATSAPRGLGAQVEVKHVAFSPTHVEWHVFRFQ